MIREKTLATITGQLLILALDALHAWLHPKEDAGGLSREKIRDALVRFGVLRLGDEEELPFVQEEKWASAYYENLYMVHLFLGSDGHRKSLAPVEFNIQDILNLIENDGGLRRDEKESLERFLKALTSGELKKENLKA